MHEARLLFWTTERPRDATSFRFQTIPKKIKKVVSHPQNARPFPSWSCAKLLRLPNKEAVTVPGLHNLVCLHQGGRETLQVFYLWKKSWCLQNERADSKEVIWKLKRCLTNFEDLKIYHWTRKSNTSLQGVERLGLASSVPRLKENPPGADSPICSSANHGSC